MTGASDVEERVALFKQCSVPFELGCEAFDLDVAPLQTSPRGIASVGPALRGKLVTPGREIVTLCRLPVPLRVAHAGDVPAAIKVSPPPANRQIRG